MASTSTDRSKGVNAGKAIKVPCRAATTANITLSGEQTIDGVACVSGDRVLVKNQTDTVENGIYACNTGTWQREPDWNGVYDVAKGTLINVTEGTANQNTIWQVTTSDPITPSETNTDISLTGFSDLTPIENDIEELDQRVSAIESEFPLPDPGVDQIFVATIDNDKLTANILVINYTGDAWTITSDTTATPTYPADYIAGGAPNSYLSPTIDYGDTETFRFWQYEIATSTHTEILDQNNVSGIDITPVDTLGPVWTAGSFTAADDGDGTASYSISTAPTDAGSGLRLTNTYDIYDDGIPVLLGFTATSGDLPIVPRTDPYQLECYAYDDFGNSSIQTYTLTFAGDNGTVEIAAAQYTVTEGDSVNISLTWDGSGSNPTVKVVTYENELSAIDDNTDAVNYNFEAIETGDAKSTVTWAGAGTQTVSFVTQDQSSATNNQAFLLIDYDSTQAGAAQGVQIGRESCEIIINSSASGTSGYEPYTEAISGSSTLVIPVEAEAQTGVTNNAASANASHTISTYAYDRAYNDVASRTNHTTNYGTDDALDPGGAYQEVEIAPSTGTWYAAVRANRQTSPVGVAQYAHLAILRQAETTGNAIGADDSGGAGNQLVTLENNHGYQVGDEIHMEGLGNYSHDATRDRGSHTGSNNAATLTDSAANGGSGWAASSLIGRRVHNITDGSFGTITANTGTTITATLGSGTDNDWDTNDEYYVGGYILQAVSGATFDILNTGIGAQTATAGSSYTFGEATLLGIFSERIVAPAVGHFEWIWDDDTPTNRTFSIAGTAATYKLRLYPSDYQFTWDSYILTTTDPDSTTVNQIDKLDEDMNSRGNSNDDYYSYAQATYTQGGTPTDNTENWDYHPVSLPAATVAPTTLSPLNGATANQDTVGASFTNMTELHVNRFPVLFAGSQVSGSFAFGSNTTTFTPSNNDLAAGAYTADIEGRIRDTDGDVKSVNIATWAFDIIDSTSPGVIWEMDVSAYADGYYLTPQDAAIVFDNPGLPDNINNAEPFNSQRVQVVTDPFGSGEKVLRIFFAGGVSGHNDTGGQWSVLLGSNYEELYFGIRYGVDDTWVTPRGIHLPFLASEPWLPGDWAVGGNTYSCFHQTCGNNPYVNSITSPINSNAVDDALLMYIYTADFQQRYQWANFDNITAADPNSIPLPASQPTLGRNEYTHFVTRLALNTAPASDGVIQAWANGVQCANWSNYRFRTSNTVDINKLICGFHVGGVPNNPEWYVQSDQWLYIKSMVVSTSAIS